MWVGRLDRADDRSYFLRSIVHAGSHRIRVEFIDLVGCELRNIAVSEVAPLLARKSLEFSNRTILPTV